MNLGLLRVTRARTLKELETERITKVKETESNGVDLNLKFDFQLILPCLGVLDLLISFL